MKRYIQGLAVYLFFLFTIDFLNILPSYKGIHMSLYMRIIVVNIVLIAETFLVIKIFSASLPMELRDGSFKKRLCLLPHGIKKNLHMFWIGFFSGGFAIFLIFLILLFVGKIKVAGVGFSYQIVFPLLMFFVSGFSEELFFRGFVIDFTKKSGKSGVFPVIFSSFIFACAHLKNPFINMIALTNIFISGLFFGFLYCKSKNIFLPTGFHIGWNFFQGSVFGFHVSGLLGESVVKITGETGFGPEGSWAATFVLTVLLLTVLFSPPP